jgi:SAM-dependent methyltransferase
VTDASRWDAEYRVRGIPSSWRDEPSGVVQWALNSMSRTGTAPGPGERVLDSGCGTGRNAVAVARAAGCSVLGIDFSVAALRLAAERAAAAPDVSGRVAFARSDVRHPLPVAAASVACVLDVFVYFHIPSPSARARYLHEIERVLQPGGHLVLSLASADDGYYGACPAHPSWHGRSRVPVVLDPRAGVPNVMHTLDTLQEEVAGMFRLVSARRRERPDVMHGSTYRRVTLGTLWQKSVPGQHDGPDGGATTIRAPEHRDGVAG